MIFTGSKTTAKDNSDDSGSGTVVDPYDGIADGIDTSDRNNFVFVIVLIVLLFISQIGFAYSAIGYGNVQELSIFFLVSLL